MTRQYIKSISIEGFRGINNENDPLILDFKMNGITSIFATNGIGKSSIFDALSYCLNDELKCLKPLQHENQDKTSIQNIFHSGDGKIDIVLCDNNGAENTINIKIDNQGGKEVVSSNKLVIEAIIEDIKDIHNFLDYNAFADIIYSNPKDAGKIFLKLIGYEEFSEIQDSLDTLARTQNLTRDYKIEADKNEVRGNREKIVSLKETILENTVDVGLRNKTVNIKAISKSSINGIKKLTRYEGASFFDVNITDLINTVNEKNDEYDAHKESLIKIVQERELLKKHRLNIKSFSKSKIERANKLLKSAYNILNSDKDKHLGELYEKAINIYSVFEDVDRNSCVLCNTSELGTKNKSFLNTLEKNIIKYNSFKSKYEKFKSLFNQFVDYSQVLEIENTLKSESIIEDKEFTTFYHSQAIVSEDKFLSSDYFKVVQKYQLEIDNLIKVKNESISKIKELIPDELHVVITKLALYKTIQEDLLEITTLGQECNLKEGQIKRAEEWVQFIITVKDKFVSENNKVIKLISQDITSDAQIFFQEIMNSPEVIPKIEKKETGQKMVMLLEKFYSATNKKAATLLSESNRNALCLSIYFACALNKSKSGFIVLDDITSSFDSGHQRNLLSLLKNKISRISTQKGKQIILLTHDGELEKSLKSYSSELKTKWIHYALSRESNLKVDKKSISSGDIGIALKSKASAGENVSNEIRKYFEKIILDIHKYVKIPMTYDLANERDKRMLHGLITNLRNVLKLYNSASSYHLINTLPSDSDIVDILILEKDIANIVSHYESDDASSYTPSFILGVINRIDLFNQKFQYNCTCPEINGGMTYYAKLNSKKVKGCKCTL